MYGVGSAAWSKDLQCYWLSWEAHNDHRLRLNLPRGQCCSMAGAIKVAKAMAQIITSIDTYVGGKPDTLYLLVWGPRPKWRAFDAESAEAQQRRAAWAEDELRINGGMIGASTDP